MRVAYGSQRVKRECVVLIALSHQPSFFNALMALWTHTDTEASYGRLARDTQRTLKKLRLKGLIRHTTKGLYKLTTQGKAVVQALDTKGTTNDKGTAGHPAKCLRGSGPTAR